MCKQKIKIKIKYRRGLLFLGDLSLYVKIIHYKVIIVTTRIIIIINLRNWATLANL